MYRSAQCHGLVGCLLHRKGVSDTTSVDSSFGGQHRTTRLTKHGEPVLASASGTAPFKYPAPDIQETPRTSILCQEQMVSRGPYGHPYKCHPLVRYTSASLDPPRYESSIGNTPGAKPAARLNASPNIRVQSSATPSSMPNSFQMIGASLTI